MFNPTSNREEQASLPNFGAAFTSSTSIRSDRPSESLTIAEWKTSAVDEDLIKINARPIKAGQWWNWLFYSENLPRTNTGRLSSPILNRYKQLDHSDGWLVVNQDPFTGEDRLYVRGKLLSPRRDKNGKWIKYENPPQVPTEPLFIRIIPKIWQRIIDLVNKQGLVAVETPQLKLDPLRGAVTVDGNLTFWQWLAHHPEIPVWITEGEKKAASLLSRGIVAISVPGIFNCYDIEQSNKDQGLYILHSFLLHYAQNNRHIVICFDQEDPKKPKTIANVTLAIKRLGKAISLTGCPVSVAKWDNKAGISKDFKGFDPKSSNNILKGIDDFLAAGHTLDEVTLTPFDEWREKDEIIKLRQLTYGISCQLDTRYIPNLPIPNNKLIAIRSPKGSGKTQLLREWVKEWLGKEFRIIALTHRRNLGRDSGNRLKLEWYEDIISDPDKRKLANLFGYILCFDSLKEDSAYPFNIDSWLNDDRPYVVLLDECEQSFWHLLNAKTEVKKNRPEVIENFHSLLENAAHIVACDADLSDISVYYLCKEAKTNNPWILLNTQQGLTFPCYAYEGRTPTRLWQDILSSVGVGKHLIFTTGQQARSTWGTTNLEKGLEKKYPNKKILRIDADTVDDPSHAAFKCIDKLNELIQYYDIIICSPSVETGISLDAEHPFTNVWGIFWGKQTSDAVRQALARYRGQCPRRIWVNETGLNGDKIGNGSYHVKSLLRSQHQRFADMTRYLSSIGAEDEYGNVSNDAHNTWAKLACRINYGFTYYRDDVVRGLQGEGHEIIWVDALSKQESKLISSEVKVTRDETYKEERVETSASVSVDDKTLEELEKKSKTKPERLQLKKGRLERKYGHKNNKASVNPDLIKWDDEGIYPKLKLHYYGTVGKMFLPEQDKKAVAEAARFCEGRKIAFLWLPDAIESVQGLKVMVLEYLGIYKLAALRGQTDLKFTQEHPMLVEMADKFYQITSSEKSLEQLNNWFKTRVKNPSSLTPVEIGNWGLQHLGLEMLCLGQRTIGRDETGKAIRIREYGVPVPTYLSDAVEEERERRKDVITSLCAERQKWINALSEFKLERRELTILIPGRSKAAISQRKIKRANINELIAEATTTIESYTEKIRALKLGLIDWRLHSTDIRFEVFTRWLERDKITFGSLADKTGEIT